MDSVYPTTEDPPDTVAPPQGDMTYPEALIVENYIEVTHHLPPA
jgi:hypothetical protein